jgi:plastocyanin
MNNKLIIGIITIILVIVAGYFLLNNSKSKVENVEQPITKATKPTAEPIKAIKVTKNGFEPSNITIKAGTRLIWINESGEPATVNSDNHPTHLLFPFLNLGEFDNKSSVQADFDKAGTYTYHNHLNPEEKGKVVVE